VFKKGVREMKTRNKTKIKTLVITIALFAVSFFITGYVGADTPIISDANPIDGLTYVYAYSDTQEGAGCPWNISIYDADTDLQTVRLRENSSGTWSEFYDSGDLVGVEWHNASGVNANWTGSWTTYYWQICREDGVDWYNTTYSFTTAYQWGQIQMFNFSDEDNHDMGFCQMLRNDTGEYHAVYYCRDTAYAQIKNSTTATNWSLVEPYNYGGSAYDIPHDIFKYNNTYYWITNDYSTSSNDHYDCWHWNGTTYVRESTGIQSSDEYYSPDNRVYHAWGWDTIYYGGYWNVIVNTPYGNQETYLNHYTGTFPANWTLKHQICTINEHGTDTEGLTFGMPSVEIWNGILYLTYIDNVEDLYWRYYDGVDWFDGGVIYADTLHTDSSITGSGSLDVQYRGCDMTKDLINNHLVIVYCNNTGGGLGTVGALPDKDGCLVYQVFNGTGWEESQIIFRPETGKQIMYPEAEFIDSRLTVSFSYNLRGENAIYTISAPGYAKSKSGLNTTYNRIQFPDASPSATNVNSTVFHLKNVDNRNITAIDWHFENIGDITKANNFKIWTNMSGSWNGWQCDADGDISEIDISSEMAGGLEWEKGQTTYWKLEILAVGGVAEDFHATDEDIFYKITLA